MHPVLNPQFSRRSGSWARFSE